MLQLDPSQSGQLESDFIVDCFQARCVGILLIYR